MRSRYSAFCTNNEDYLHQTCLEDTVPITLTNYNWEKLIIIKTHLGLLGDTDGTIEFNAYFTENKRRYFLHEISQFKQSYGRWYYVNGEAKVIQY